MSSYWKLHGINEVTHHDAVANEKAEFDILEATNPNWDYIFEDNFYSDEKWDKWWKYVPHDGKIEEIANQREWLNES